MPVVPDHGCLADDLLALMMPHTQPLTRDERAAASLAGSAHRHDGIRAGLHQALTDPLHQMLALIAHREAFRGHPIPLAGRRQLGLMVSALWWSRLITDPPPTAVDDLRLWVREVLLPSARGPHLALRPTGDEPVQPPSPPGPG